MSFNNPLAEVDPEIFQVVTQELNRQRNTLELIASENIVSRAVMEAQGTVLTNKYAEGLPGKRYYGGCAAVDVAEALAIERAKKIFNAEHVNVQPHSGSQANTASYYALLEPGDTILGMSLAHGGHLTHGSPLNISGHYFNVVSYGVEPDTGRINYDKVMDIASESKAKMIVAGASAYPREIDFTRMAEIAAAVGAYLLVDMAHIAGLVAAGLHNSPVPCADVVTTTTHKTLRGPRGGMILCKEKYGTKVDKAVFPGIQGGPLMHVIAAKAVAFGEALQPGFKEYQQQIVNNARVLAEALSERGFELISGGTDNHMMLVDLRNKQLTGREAEQTLDEVGVTVNKNAIPFDPQKPLITSGVRIGTPAVTTRGLKEAEMVEIAEIIHLTLSFGDDAGRRAQAKEMSADICRRFPIYEEGGIYAAPRLG